MAIRARLTRQHKSKQPQLVRKGKQQDVLDAEFRRHRALRIFAVVCILAVVVWVFVAFFSPGLNYQMAQAPRAAIDSPEFLREVEALADSRISRNNRIEALPNGENFYEAEIAAMRQARHNINIDAYIFHRGDLAKRVLNVLTERARNGVRVALTIDAIGSSITPKSYFDDLRKAGGRVQWYHKVRWNTWMRSNNRTHREILTVDGQVGFVGGAGYDDQWVYSKKAGEPRWRDTMFRVEGDAVLGLQSAVVQNWLEASGEILDGPGYFPSATNAGSTPALVIASTPTTSGATRARILFQALMAAARKSIDITTPYFVPDSSARNELVRAMRERHVTVRILVPGPKNDHPSIRHTSRSMYGDLLRSGAHIYEYTPTMLHAKIMVVDGAWVVVGSTNFDPRSFGIDDEDNLAALDPQLAQTLTAEFDNDLKSSRRVSYEQWKNRSPYERALEWLGALWERQQ
jgi:cardiolipin synthase